MGKGMVVVLDFFSVAAVGGMLMLMDVGGSVLVVVVGTSELTLIPNNS